jgi:O-antigen ligase
MKLPVIVDTDLFIKGSCWAEFSVLERVTLVLALLTPIFFLSIRHWISNVSILAALLCVSLAYIQRFEFSWQQVPHLKIITLLFSVYALGILISQIGRQTFVMREYLDQTRWLIGLPLFIILFRYRVNYTAFLKVALPVSIFAAWLGLIFFPSDAWYERQTISFIDPLTFGHLNLTLGLVCFVSAMFDVSRRKANFYTALNILAFFVGVFLSVKSGSRTGWLAVPVVMCVVSYQIYKPRPVKSLLMVLAVISSLILFFQLNTEMASRFKLMMDEIFAYPWRGGLAPETSVSNRVTFYRLGFYYFSQSPLFGWGNRGYLDIKDAAELLTFSTQGARDFAFNALFHSDWTTQSVRYGVFGLLSVLIVFMIPFRFFVHAIRVGGDLKKVGCMGFAFTSCQLASSLSTEVYDSKGVTAFTAAILAGLLAETISRQEMLNSSSKTPGVSRKGTEV